MIQHRQDLWQVITVSGHAAEIGVAEGYFSADILAWPLKFPILYMVDRWACVPAQRGDASNPPEWHEQNYQAARERVEKHFPRPCFLRGDSVEKSRLVPDHSLAFLYIDGDHSYEGVKADLAAWAPKVVPGGVIGFHDYENPAYGVKPAVQEFCTVRGLYIHLLPEYKIEDAGAWVIV